ncbi:GroES-like protein, partial [Rhizoclosmatium globosum]
MKEIIVHPSPTLHTTSHDIPIPSPASNEIVIKVIVAGSNVKDWDHLTRLNISLNSGDDIAGIIHQLGADVEKNNEFRVGDRVAAFHPMMSPHGAFAEYAVAPEHTVFKIPEKISFEEAATIPLILTTAALTLFRRQKLPPPWTPFPPSSPPIPLIIYGASSSLGTSLIKLARASNIHPIIAIAGSSTSHISALLDSSNGDKLIDYRIGIDEMKSAVSSALGNLECHHAVDAISSKSGKTWIPVSQMMTPSTPSAPSYLSVVSGANAYDEPEIQSGVQIVYTYCGTAHSGEYKPGMPKQDVANRGIMLRYASRMLADGRLSGMPFEIVEGGLDGVEKGLRMLKEGKAKGNKFVFRVAEY